MKLESPAFENTQLIPSMYTCDGEDTRPLLAVSDVPAEAQSLAVTIDDPDAPGKTWVHWTVWNLPPTTTTIESEKLPAGAVEGMTDSGQPGYGGPCPPSGVHRYFFKLYALHTTLDLPASATKAELEAAMANHILAKSELMGTYQRR